MAPDAPKIAPISPPRQIAVMGDPLRGGNCARQPHKAQTQGAGISVDYVAPPWRSRFHRAAMPLTS